MKLSGSNVLGNKRRHHVCTSVEWLLLTDPAWQGERRLLADQRPSARCFRPRGETQCRGKADVQRCCSGAASAERSAATLASGPLELRVRERVQLAGSTAPRSPARVTALARLAVGPAVARVSEAFDLSLSRLRTFIVRRAHVHMRYGRSGQRFSTGSIPLFLIAAAARSEARNAISRLDASSSFDPATTAAANVWMSWSSAGMGPT